MSDPKGSAIDNRRPGSLTAKGGQTSKRDRQRQAARPVHPGAVLLEEFLKPNGITQTQLAEHLRTSLQRVNEIVNGKRSVTAETAWLLSEAFRTTPQFWINLQATYDLATQRPDYHVAPLRRVS